jgi:hypothetical protein
VVIDRAFDTSAASVNSALQQARAVIRQRTPERSQQQELADLGVEVRALAARYAAAWEASDVESVVAMLAEDVRLAMPPILTWYDGLPAVRAALATGPLTHSLCGTVASSRSRHFPLRSPVLRAGAGDLLLTAMSSRRSPGLYR